MILGTYNGVSIIALPSAPAPKQVQLEMNDMVAAPANPFTGSQQQVLQWPGGDFWSGQIAMPKLVGQQINVWNAWLAECRGKLNVFQLGDSSYKGARGSKAGTPLVKGAQAAMATSLVTQGWTPNANGVLLAGDYLQLGAITDSAPQHIRLHRVVVDVNADSSGDATITIWPSLREAVTDGQAITLNNPVGLFRLADNKRSMSVDETLLGATSFNVVEAR